MDKKEEEDVLIRWNQFKSCLIDCAFKECYRNNTKMPFLFDRKIETLSSIKFVIISQDPSIALKKDFYDLNGMKQFLQSECYQKRFESRRLNKRGIPYAIRNIFGGDRINLESDEIYWTHALKCPPIENNNEIKNKWNDCAPFCFKYLRKEILLLPADEIKLITFGGNALSICLTAINSRPEPKKIEIIEFIKNYQFEPINFGGKTFHLFPFIHPSNRNRVPSPKKPLDRKEIEEKEKKFIKEIRETARRYKRKT